MRQTPPLHRMQMRLRTLLHVLLVSSTQTSAQRACGATQNIIRVQDATGVDILRTALSCTGGGAVEAQWVGSVSVNAPIAVVEGIFLSVTGEDARSEVHGGGAQTRLFDVSPGGSLTLTRLKLSGGSAEGGGAIYSQHANLALDNCTFHKNVATDGNGGAVWATGGNVTIVGGEFSANNATRYGGAVYAVEGRLVFQGGSRFQDNKAIVGGALFCGVEGGATKTAAFCSITDAKFVSNSAARDNQDWVEHLSDLDGGGAAMFKAASVEITDSEFSGNHALLAGGALHGGFDANISVNGCIFGNNTAEKFGGAISASSLTLGGSTQLSGNLAYDDGGAVLGWNENGTIVFHDVLCTENLAKNNGGCFYGFGKAIFHNGTTVLDNTGTNGGSIYAAEGSDISVRGGTFTSRSSERGGFLYASDKTRVNITAGVFENSIVSKRGGALYCNGNEESDISISGGTFRNNRAYEMGGAIAAWGTPALVQITGGTFENNHARYYGGFVFVEEGASFACEGGTIRGNSADDQGGGIYARESIWVNSSCDLVENKSPQGAAIYLTNVNSATFENHNVTDNLVTGGSVVYVAASPVVAKHVTFESSVGLQEYSFNRALQLDDNTTLHAEGCVFDGWMGDTVIFNANAADGSLVVNSCDFSGSSAIVAVLSPKSDAEIRNAVVSNLTFTNAVDNSSWALVDRALDCSHSNACGAGDCVDSLLGVLCECLEGGECLNNGGKLSLSLTKPPKPVTYSPDKVSYELVISSAAVGTTLVIWDMAFDGGDLHLDVVPSSGVLHPGGSITVSVSGIPSTEDVGGGVTNSFHVTSHSNATADVRLAVTATIYLCHAYQYAMPDDGGDDNIVQCKQCSTIQGYEGVNCTSPGATRTSLPIQQGFWRSGPDSTKVHECLHFDACVGATKVSDSDDYCADGYKGPYCAVCAEGYGRGVSNTCHFCSNTKARLLFTIGALFALVMFLLLSLAVVFLIGGLDAIEMVRHSVGRTLCVGSKESSCGPFVQKNELQERRFSDAGYGMDSLNATVAPFEFDSARSWSDVRSRVDSVDATVVPAFSFASEAKYCGDDCGGSNVASTRKMFPTNKYELDDLGRRDTGHTGGVVEDGVDLSDVTSRNTPRNSGLAIRRNARLSAAAGKVTGSHASNGVKAKASDDGTSMCCRLGKKMKRWMSRLPWNKLKILVIVWQILAVCSSITGIEFPVSYARFLSWINIANFDVGDLFSASCLIPSLNFYQRLLLTTMTPLVLTAVLALTYNMAKRRAGIGRAGVIALRAAWSRHVAAGLLLTFLVFTSASTATFKTFACDDDIEKGQSYLRADYSLSCHSDLHLFFQVYAGLMIVIYPIGIPALYAAILWKNRELLNPRIDAQLVGVDEPATSGNDKSASSIIGTPSKGPTKNKLSAQELQELKEKVEARRAHPELVPSMFLWKDFGPDLYYYEVIECGRRMLLTGVLVFIAPHTATQVAMACVFAFASILGFELMRPHMDPTDSWLYRLGCVIIFLSNFLALLIKVKAGEESNRAAFGVLLVAVNVLLVLAVLVTSWFAVQQSVDDCREEENSFAIAKTMLTAEQDTVKHARLVRGKQASISSQSFSSRPSLPRSDLDGVWRGPTASNGRHGSSAGKVASREDAESNVLRVISGISERFRTQRNAPGNLASGTWSRPSQTKSIAML